MDEGSLAEMWDQLQEAERPLEDAALAGGYPLVPLSRQPDESPSMTGRARPKQEARLRAEHRQGTGRQDIFPPPIPLACLLLPRASDDHSFGRVWNRAAGLIAPDR